VITKSSSITPIATNFSFRILCFISNTPVLLHTFVFYLKYRKKGALVTIFSIIDIDSQLFFSKVEKELIET